MASLIDYLRPHATTTYSKGKETFYPAPGYMFTIAGGSRGELQISRITRIEHRFELLDANAHEIPIWDSIEFDKLPITVWHKIERQ